MGWKICSSSPIFLLSCSLVKQELLLLTLVVVGSDQSRAKLGGAPSSFLMTLPDLFRVNVKTGGVSWGGTCWFSSTGAVRRVRSSAGTRGWTSMQPECFRSNTTLRVVLKLSMEFESLVCFSVGSQEALYSVGIFINNRPQSTINQYNRTTKIYIQSNPIQRVLAWSRWAPYELKL